MRLMLMLQTELCICDFATTACDQNAGTSTGSILAANIATAGAGLGNSGFLTTDAEMTKLYDVRRHRGAAKGSLPFSGRVMLARVSQNLQQTRSAFWRCVFTQNQVICEYCHATLAHAGQIHVAVQGSNDLRIKCSSSWSLPNQLWHIAVFMLQCAVGP